MECSVLDEELHDLIEEVSSELETDPKITTENCCANEQHQEFTCFHCFKNFESQINLLVHIEVEHFTFICEKCNKQFPTDKRLKKHLLEAHLSGKFPCPICGKLFTRKDQCKDHIYTHSEKPMFHCKYEKCGKVFRQTACLRQHERTHTGEYRKTCPICNESVVQFAKHMNTHTKTKQHPCGSCNKSFTRRCYLLEHEKIHLGEVGFICSECHVEFTTSNALYKHNRSKHSKERYICEISKCRQEFNRKDNMVTHMKRVHKLAIETVKSTDAISN